MKNIIANFERQTLTITKAFAKKASVYGTPAYKELAEAKRDNDSIDNWFPYVKVDICIDAKVYE